MSESKINKDMINSIGQNSKKIKQSNTNHANKIDENRFLFVDRTIRWTEVGRSRQFKMTTGSWPSIICAHPFPSCCNLLFLRFLSVCFFNVVEFCCSCALGQVNEEAKRLAENAKGVADCNVRLCLAASGTKLALKNQNSYVLAIPKWCWIQTWAPPFDHVGERGCNGCCARAPILWINIILFIYLTTTTTNMSEKYFGVVVDECLQNLLNLAKHQVALQGNLQCTRR